jgi:tRNA(Ile)-lysidine synthase
MRRQKKLQDFFIDQQVPNYLRKRVPVLECEQGIVWIAGYRIDHRYRVTDNTRQVLEVEIVEIS